MGPMTHPMRLTRSEKRAASGRLEDHALLLVKQDQRGDGVSVASSRARQFGVAQHGPAPLTLVQQNQTRRVALVHAQPDPGVARAIANDAVNEGSLVPAGSDRPTTLPWLAGAASTCRCFSPE